MKTLTLICGIPNAGKTTYSAKFDNVIHFDNVQHRSVAQQFAACNCLAAAQTGDTCVEGVYNTAERRKELLKTAGPKFDKKVCLWMDTPAEICAERSECGRSAQIVYAHAARFEEPTENEGWDEIVRVRS